MPVHTLPPDKWPIASPLIIADAAGYITIAIELPKAELARHLRFLEALVGAAKSVPARD